MSALLLAVASATPFRSRRMPLAEPTMVLVLIIDMHMFFVQLLAEYVYWICNLAGYTQSFLEEGAENTACPRKLCCKNGNKYELCPLETASECCGDAGFCCPVNTKCSVTAGARPMCVRAASQEGAYRDLSLKHGCVSVTAAVG